MKENKSKHRRAVNFDLSSHQLQKYYPNPQRWRKAYKDVEKHLLNNGFKHRQWSGYLSKKPMTDYEVASYIKNLNSTFYWLKYCVNQFDVTIADGKYNYLDCFNNDEDTELLKEHHLISKQSNDKTDNSKYKESKQAELSAVNNQQSDVKIDNKSIVENNSQSDELLFYDYYEDEEYQSPKR